MGSRGRRVGLRRGGAVEPEVRVPDIVGMYPWEARRLVAMDNLGLTGPGAHADETGGWLGRRIAGQAPSAGEWLPPGGTVTVWFDDGPGSAGIREPRRPVPPVRSDDPEPGL
ncbi:PASTA domain-containing protein [Amycolatopsis sp. NPDC058278]|uniref:PASTA domain-containing protein n=1 Tax=Amycolatopsis sp. NPDC058278 TaxID=3346417 RepID=UPI0036DA4BAA